MVLDKTIPKLLETTKFYEQNPLLENFFIFTIYQTYPWL